MFISFLLIIATILCGLCVCSLYESGRAADWLSDLDNQRRLRKCFRQEGIQIYLNGYDRTVSVSLSNKGSHIEGYLSYVEAYNLFHRDPKGHGLRAILVDKFKKPL